MLLVVLVHVLDVEGDVLGVLVAVMDVKVVAVDVLDVLQVVLGVHRVVDVLAVADVHHAPVAVAVVVQLVAGNVVVDVTEHVHLVVAVHLAVDVVLDALVAAHLVNLSALDVLLHAGVDVQVVVQDVLEDVRHVKVVQLVVEDVLAVAEVAADVLGAPADAEVDVVEDAIHNVQTAAKVVALDSAQTLAATSVVEDALELVLMNVQVVQTPAMAVVRLRVVTLLHFLRQAKLQTELQLVKDVPVIVVMDVNLLAIKAVIAPVLANVATLAAAVAALLVLLDVKLLVQELQVLQ